MPVPNNCLRLLINFKEYTPNQWTRFCSPRLERFYEELSGLVGYLMSVGLLEGRLRIGGIGEERLVVKAGPMGCVLRDQEGLDGEWSLIEVIRACFNLDNYDAMLTSSKPSKNEQWLI